VEPGPSTLDKAIDERFNAVPRALSIAIPVATFGSPQPVTSQLYAIDSNLTILVTQANNAGTLVSVGAFGFDVPDAGFGGFDIANDGTAIAAFNDGIETSSFYTVNLTTGAATNIGSIPFVVRGLSATAVPELGSFAVLGLAMAVMIARRRQLKK